MVSTLELTYLADLYGRPVEWFVSPNSPVEQEDPVVALFRAEPGLQSEVVQKQARRCLRLLREGASLRRLTGGRDLLSPYRVTNCRPRDRVGQGHCPRPACGRAGASASRFGPSTRQSA